MALPASPVWELAESGVIDMRANIEISILGPLEVRQDGSLVHIGGHNLRAVLAALVLSVNHAVSADHLAWVVWGDSPPATGAATLQSYVSRLRHELGTDAVISEDHSYVLEAECRQVDCCRFEQMVHRAQEVVATAPHEALTVSRSAIDLWRGPVLGDLGDEEWARLEAIRLEELRLLAVEIETESELRLGRCGECASRLQALVIEYPYRERFWQQLVFALFTSGRRLESMTAFDEYQKWMAESGLEPEFNFDELVASSSYG